MTKINRTNETERYAVTVGWVKDFINKVAKIPPPKPNISTAKTEKFATIEEKMQDIMSRVGFKNIQHKKEGSEEDKQKIAAKKSCNCEGNCNCEDVRKVEVILKYIQDTVKNEPELPSLAILDRCRNHSGLYFDTIKIDVDKLKKYIQSLKEQKGTSKIDTAYVKQESTSTDRQDDMADYYRHGIPETR